MKPKYYISVVAMVLLMIISVVLPSAVLYAGGNPYGLFYCVPGVGISLVVAMVLFYADRSQMRKVAQMSKECQEIELQSIQQLPIGLCVLDSKNIVVRHNDYFCEQVLDGSDMIGRNLRDIIPFDPTAVEQEVFFQNRYYYVSSVTTETENGNLTAYLWSDITELESLQKEYENTRPCVLLIVVDSYEDLIQNARESTKLEASVAIEKLLESFIAETNGILRRLKNDRFVAVLEEQHVQKLINGKFKILDDARNIQIDDRSSLTLSIGVGHGAKNLQESEVFAEQCLDMALGRGGDQAAVKMDGGFRFFGGVSKGVEKKSRAKTRIVAGAIQDLIQDCNNVFLMGHRFGDLDSIGGCCGLAGAIRLMGVPVNVVVHPEKNLSHQLIDLVSEEVGGDLFLTPEQAIDTITEDTLLIIADTHNKDILESMDLYKAAKKVVVIDHHRKNVNFVDNAVVFHHEPYASSACEMITELIQYFKFEGTLDAVYANCLLSGIMLDTKNFIMRTGVRTFEAAAYLRKIGADTVKVKGLFSGSIEAYRSRTEIVGSAEIHGNHAIAIAPQDTPELRLVAPQAADELLNITGVEAAFVIYKTGDMVSISARSFGAVNVQVIMEQLGGGGHQSMAATQIMNISEMEAKEQLLKAIEETEED
ncbi:MAG: DHH family phosphoesterase [Oscillospiraceae bacterium]